MSTERFEQDLAEVPRADLPPHFREETLAKACVAPAQPLLRRWWNSTPKPLAAAVAAAWVAIAMLGATTPRAERTGSQPETVVENPTNGHAVAWVQRQRTILQSL